MKKTTKKSLYLRYEFTNEAGKLEGGDIFEYNSMSQIQDMVEQIIKVTHNDEVAVNVTFGTQKPFFGFLKNVGMSQKDLDSEMVDPSFDPLAEAVPAQKAATKKAAKKAPAKKTKKK